MREGGARLGDERSDLDDVLHAGRVLDPGRDIDGARAKLDAFTKLGRQWLAGLALDEAGRQILDRQLAVIDELDERVDESTASLRALAR